MFSWNFINIIYLTNFFCYGLQDSWLDVLEFPLQNSLGLGEGCWGHPSAATQRFMAEKLSDKLRGQLHW
jgi:hypothetical protein